MEQARHWHSGPNGKGPKQCPGQVTRVLDAGQTVTVLNATRVKNTKKQKKQLITRSCPNTSQAQVGPNPKWIPSPIGWGHEWVVGANGNPGQNETWPNYDQGPTETRSKYAHGTEPQLGRVQLGPSPI